MRRALRILVVCLLLALAGAGVAAAQSAAGGMFVSTLPADADVWVDGAYIGRSPLLVEGLGEGRHALTVTKAGWISQELTIVVQASAVAMAGVELSAATAHPGASPRPSGAYILRRGPSGASFSIDGEPVKIGAQPVSISSGIHRLSVVTAKGSVTREFDVFPGTTTALALLAAAPGAPARATVIAQCSDYLPDGSYSIASNRFSIRYNRHEVAGDIGVSAVRFDGVAVAYDAAPAIIGGRLYLPIALLEKLTAKSATGN
jgi:hypothetical protein